MTIQEVIRKRRSVRAFNGKPLNDTDKQNLLNCFQTSTNPFGIPVEFRFLNAKEHDLSSPVIVGTDEYVAAKVSRTSFFEVAYGYSFEKFCLYALSLGIGTVMLAGTLSRKTFEKAMELAENEIMLVASPVGYPADKMSVREKIMRKGVKANERLPFEKLFFEGTFEQPLTANNAGNLRDALEMVRLAPSAVNKQPWRAVVCKNVVHFFEKKSNGLQNEIRDLQKVDIGIALAHFHLTLQEMGISGTFVTKDIDFTTDKATEYVISFEVQ